MLITKFNALIRNRFVWGIFAVLISITMVGFFTDIEGCSPKAGGPDTVGTLDGEPVSYRALQRARSHILLRIRLAGGQDFSLTPEMDRLVNREAWKRLATLQLAEQNGLVAADREVAAALHRDTMFQENGVFSRDRYGQFLQLLGNQFGLFPAQFEDYMREELTIDKVRRSVAAATWAAPYDVDRLVRNFADSLTIAYTETPRASLTRGVSVTEEQVRAFYEAHPDRFAIPDKMQAAYVAFPFADYTASVTVTPESVTNYYADHLNDYFTTNADGSPLALKLEEVEDSIREALVAESGRDLAYEDAARFSDSLYDRSAETNFFYAAAGAIGRKPALTRFFSEEESLEELGVGPDFNRTAFALTPDKDAAFSEPVLGSNAVYVLAYERLQPARMPPFDEVRDPAHALALADARARTLQEKSTTLVAAVRESLRSGASFGEALKAAGLSDEVKQAGPFTAHTTPDELDHARLITAIIPLEPGEITDLIPTERNTLFLAQVVARAPGETGVLDPIRNQIRSSLNRRHAQLLVSDWEEDLLRQKGYQEPPEETWETDDDDAKPAPDTADAPEAAL